MIRNRECYRHLTEDEILETIDTDVAFSGMHMRVLIEKISSLADKAIGHLIESEGLDTKDAVKIVHKHFTDPTYENVLAVINKLEGKQ